MAVDILKAIRAQESRFSKGQRAIAQYITQSYDKAAFLTASKLGKLTGVSESTVVRFAAELGYDGYPSMQKALQELVRNQLTAGQRMEGEGNTRDVAAAVLQGDMDAIRRTDALLDRQTLEKAAEAILTAKHVYVVGARLSKVLADYFAYYLGVMLDSVRLVAPGCAGEMLEQLVHLTEHDVVICVSVPRYFTEMDKVLQLCRDVGAKLVAIADSQQAPAARAADYCLLTKSNQVSVVDSLAAPLSLVNALLASVGHRRETELAGICARLERIRKENEDDKSVEN